MAQWNKKTLTQSEQQEIIHRYTSGEKISKIVKDYNCGSKKIYDVLIDANIKKRNKKIIHEHKIKISKATSTEEIIVRKATDEYIDHLLECMHMAYQMHDTSQSVIMYGLENFEHILKTKKFEGIKYIDEKITIKK